MNLVKRYIGEHELSLSKGFLPQGISEGVDSEAIVLFVTGLGDAVSSVDAVFPIICASSHQNFV